MKKDEKFGFSIAWDNPINQMLPGLVNLLLFGVILSVWR
jgi:hypothetical protein